MKTAMGTTGLPASGWSIACIFRNYGPDRVKIKGVDCEVCGHANLVYSYALRHPEVPNEMMVGCECCGKMTGDFDTPRRLLNEQKQRTKRQKNFRQSRLWRAALRTPTVYRRVHDRDCKVLVGQTKGQRFWIATAPKHGDGITFVGLGNHMTQDAAIDALFNHLYPAPEIQSLN